METSQLQGLCHQHLTPPVRPYTLHVVQQLLYTCAQPTQDLLYTCCTSAVQLLYICCTSAHSLHKTCCTPAVHLLYICAQPTQDLLLTCISLGLHVSLRKLHSVTVCTAAKHPTRRQLIGYSACCQASYTGPALWCIFICCFQYT